MSDPCSSSPAGPQEIIGSIGRFGQRGSRCAVNVIAEHATGLSGTIEGDIGFNRIRAGRMGTRTLPDGGAARRHRRMTAKSSDGDARKAREGAASASGAAWAPIRALALRALLGSVEAVTDKMDGVFTTNWVEALNWKFWL